MRTKDVFMEAIVYTSNTGSTEQYAKLLAEKRNLPCYSLKTARAQLPEQSEILYLGWVMGGRISGYRAAAKHYRIAAVCAVGMAETGGEVLKNQNLIPQNLPLFPLQGDFDLNRLQGIYRLMMKLFIKAMQNKGQTQQDAEPQMLEMMIHGKKGIDQKNLAPVLEFCEQKDSAAVMV